MEGAYFFVEVGCAKNEPPAGGDGGPAVISCAGFLLSLRSEFRVFTEWNFPDIFSGVQINGVQSAPGRSEGGISIRVEKLVVAGKAKFHCGGRRRGACEFFTLATHQETDERGH